MKMSLRPSVLRLASLAAAILAAYTASAADVALHWLDGSSPPCPHRRKLGRAVAARHGSKRPSVFADRRRRQSPAAAKLDARVLAGWLNQVYRLCHHFNPGHDWRPETFQRLLRSRRRSQPRNRQCRLHPDQHRPAPMRYQQNRQQHRRLDGHQRLLRRPKRPTRVHPAGWAGQQSRGFTQARKIFGQKSKK